jgi:archaetidylinositol phosphate synthase
MIGTGHPRRLSQGPERGILVLEEYRDSADEVLNPVARFFIDTHPDTMTWLAFFFAICAAISFILTDPYFDQYLFDGAYMFLFLASVFIGLNALFDALDGRVARLRKMATKRGDFLDHVLDRYADVFIIGGIILCPYCDDRIGLLALLGVIFTSYMGTQAQALNLKRNYRGLLGRADRLVLLIIFPTLQLFFVTQDWTFLEVTFLKWDFSLNLLDGLMLWFAIAGHTTAIQRAYNTWEALTEREEERKRAKEERRKARKEARRGGKEGEE